MPNLKENSKAKNLPSRLFEVEIGGTPLRLRSHHDQETVSELVDMVNGKLKEALSLTRSGSPQSAAILASLHLAEEFLSWKKQAAAELDELLKQSETLLTELEASPAAPAHAASGMKSDESGEQIQAKYDDGNEGNARESISGDETGFQRDLPL